MNNVLLIFLFIIALQCFITLSLIKKKTVLFDERYGTTIIQMISTVYSISLAMHLSFILPNSLATTTTLSIMSWIILILIFEGFGRFSTFLSSYYGGIVGSLTGAMLAAVIENPAICGLPLATQSAIDLNILAFGWYSLVIISITNALTLYSLKV